MNFIGIAIGVAYTVLNLALLAWGLFLASPFHRKSFLIIGCALLLVGAGVSTCSIRYNAAHPNYGEPD